MQKKVIKQKIAFVIPSLGAGGAERVVSTLANALVKEYQVCIITYIKVEPFYHLNKDVKLLYCVDKIPPSKFIYTAIRSNYTLLNKINTIIKREKIELVIGFLTSANVLSVLAAKINSIPCIISERNNPNKNKVNIFWKLLVNFSYSKADYLVVQTKIIKDYYASSIDENKLIILPNPISKELTLRRFENYPKENIILNIGRLTDQKAQGLLIRAFVDSEKKDWKLIIIGEGPKRSEYESLINNLGLNGKVIIKEKTKNISDYYNKSKIFAFTSIFEGFPNALIEAMHFGLACVATDCPSGPSELIEDGLNGDLIPMNSKELLVVKLNELMRNEEKRFIYGEKAKIKVEPYEVNMVIKKWMEIIQLSLTS